MTAPFNLTVIQPRIRRVFDQWRDTPALAGRAQFGIRAFASFSTMDRWMSSQV